MYKLITFVIAVSLLASAPDVPKVWDDAQVAGYRMPLAGLGKPPKLISSKDYYALPEVNVKTYPVYSPDKERPRRRHLQEAGQDLRAHAGADLPLRPAHGKEGPP